MKKKKISSLTLTELNSIAEKISKQLRAYGNSGRSKESRIHSVKLEVTLDKFDSSFLEVYVATVKYPKYSPSPDSPNCWYGILYYWLDGTNGEKEPTVGQLEKDIWRELSNRFGSESFLKKHKVLR